MKTGAFKIAAIYTLLGILWITLSDKLLLVVQKHLDLGVIMFIGSVKGVCYVLITGAMLYQLIKAHTRRLANSEGQYRSYFDNYPSPQWIINRRSMLFTAVNQAAIAQYGYRRAEFLAMSALDLSPREETNEMIMLFRGLKPGLNDVGNRQHIKKDGSKLFVQMTVQLLPNIPADNALVSITLLQPNA